MCSVAKGTHLLLLGLHRCSTFDEVVGHIQVTLLDGEKKSSLPGIVSKVDLKPKLKQILYNQHVTAGCSPEEGRLPIYVYFF